MPPLPNEIKMKMTIEDADNISKLLLPKLTVCMNKKCKWNMMKNELIKVDTREYQCRFREITINGNGICNDFEEI